MANNAAVLMTQAMKEHSDYAGVQVRGVMINAIYWDKTQRLLACSVCCEKVFQKKQTNAATEPFFV